MKIYTLALFQRIQGKTVRICPVECWFSTTRKREAEQLANRKNRERGSTDPKFIWIEQT